LSLGKKINYNVIDLQVPVRQLLCPAKSEIQPVKNGRAADFADQPPNGLNRVLSASSILFVTLREGA
jgi:hypothetical protein